MSPKEFIELYLKYFGVKAPIPISVFYSDRQEAETKLVPGCMFKQFQELSRNGII